MIVAAGVAVRIAGMVGGVVIGVVAVALAQRVPSLMERESRQRPALWWATAVVIAAGFGWLAGDTGGWALLPAYLAFGGTTLAVTLTDIDHQLIPNRILFPGLGVAAGLLVIGAAIVGDSDDLIRAAIAGLVYFSGLLIVALVARGGFGMGDVKLALLLGIFLGFVGWGSLGVGFTLSILLGGVASVLVMIFTRKGRRSRFAYGPYLVAGAWIGLFWGPQIFDWYLGSGA